MDTIKPHEDCPIEYKVSLLGYDYKYIPYTDTEIALYRSLLDEDFVLIADDEQRLFPKRAAKRLELNPSSKNMIVVYCLCYSHKWQQEFYSFIPISKNIIEDCSVEFIKQMVLEGVRDGEAIGPHMAMGNLRG